MEKMKKIRKASREKEKKKKEEKRREEKAGIALLAG